MTAKRKPKAKAPRAARAPGKPGEREALRESEAKYRALFDQALDSILLLEIRPDGVPVIRDANATALLTHGYTRKELVGRPITFIDAIDVTSAMLEARAAGVQAAAGTVFEARHRRKDGSVFDLEAAVMKIDVGGKHLLLDISRDITGRKRSEAALRESEAKYRKIYESSRDAIMTTFPPDWKFASGNPATVEMFGAKDEADFTSRHPWEVSPKRQPDGELSSVKARRMMAAALEKGSSSFEWTHKKIGGPEFPAAVLLTRFELGGKVGVQATVRDLSEQKRAEGEREKLVTQVLQSQKMEAVGLLAGGIAHDFNNILTAIKCYAGFVQKGLPPDDPKAEDTREILTSVERAIILTRQLLAFSRRQIIAPRIVDINTVLGEMTNMLRRIIGGGVALKTKLFPGPCMARVDTGQLGQVIMNLVLNASDAIPGAGTITLETEVMSPPEEFFFNWAELPIGPLVRFTVRDTGTGMDDEVKRRLFEPFFTTKEQGKGTGLGLSTAFGIVKQSRGEIKVESAPGKGSAFSVYLPFAEPRPVIKDKDNEEETEEENACAEPSPKGHETVLVVEDEESLLKLCERVMLDSGYTVLAAADGWEALKLMEERGKPVDLLVTDVVMPGMNGREVARDLAAKKLVTRTLYMSGFTDEAIIKYGVLEPGLAFMYKPFTVDALLRKMRAVLDGPAGRAKA